MRGVVIPHYARPALANLYLEEHVDVPDPVLFIQQYTELMGFRWDLNDAGFATDLSEHHGDKPAVWFQVGIDSGYPIAQMLQLLAAYQDFSGIEGKRELVVPVFSSTDLGLALTPAWGPCCVPAVGTLTCSSEEKIGGKLEEALTMAEQTGLCANVSLTPCAPSNPGSFVGNLLGRSTQTFRFSFLRPRFELGGVPPVLMAMVCAVETLCPDSYVDIKLF